MNVDLTMLCPKLCIFNPGHAFKPPCTPAMEKGKH